MPIYCDESGSLSAGVMVFAAVAFGDATAADDLLARFRTASGLRGELKGSRITVVERALVLELFQRFGGRAWLAYTPRGDYPDDRPVPDDHVIYTRLLDAVLNQWTTEQDPPVDHRIEIDAGRYDGTMLGVIRSRVETALDGWGHITVADSARTPGIQVADVIANSLYNIVRASPRSRRIGDILEPFRHDGSIRIVRLDGTLSP